MTDPQREKETPSKRRHRVTFGWTSREFAGQMRPRRVDGGYLLEIASFRPATVRLCDTSTVIDGTRNNDAGPLLRLTCARIQLSLRERRSWRPPIPSTRRRQRQKATCDSERESERRRSRDYARDYGFPFRYPLPYTHRITLGSSYVASLITAVRCKFYIHTPLQSMIITLSRDHLRRVYRDIPRSYVTRANPRIVIVPSDLHK